MTLRLPEALEVWTDSVDEMHRPGVYALNLARPDNVADAWDQHFDVRPEWFEQFRHATGVIYVGASGDVLSRLEDHVDGEVRKAALLRVCDIKSLHSVWWFDSADRAFERESGIAVEMQHQYPGYYVHQR